MDSQYVIIGGGLAGGKAAEALREHGFDGTIILLCAEAHLPYERPPLSKDLLAGRADRASVFVHDADWYVRHRIDVRTGVRATRIDRGERLVGLDDGGAVHYDKLLLATGSAPRQFPGDPDVRYLRTLDDAQALRAGLGDGRSLLIVGAGWIGLEAAATARQAGTAVTVVEPAELPLRTVLGERLGRLLADLHRGEGVDLRLGVSVDDVTATGVTTAGGEELIADTVLVGIGAVPQVGLAEEAGLAVGDGVEVDAGLRTDDPDIFAVGDIADHDHPLFGRLRVEHWATALNQPAVAAANMLGGDLVYDKLPYFYTDQFGFSMEYRGHASGDDTVVLRGDTDSLEFLAFWLDADQRVLAGMNVNRWDDGGAIAHLVRARAQVDPDRLADPRIALTDL